MQRMFLLAATSKLWLLATFLLEGTGAHADFPEVSKLPSRPELPDPLVRFNGDRVSTREQ